jgi:HK97 gp10 family phage protein
MSTPDALDAALARVAASISGEQLEQLARQALAGTAEHARGHVAVETGEVRNAIAVTGHYSATKATAAVEVLGSGPGGPAREAIFLEFGTSKMAAEPFLRPALAATQADIANTITAGLAGILKQHE